MLSWHSFHLLTLYYQPAAVIRTLQYALLYAHSFLLSRIVKYESKQWIVMSVCSIELAVYWCLAFIVYTFKLTRCIGRIKSKANAVYVLYSYIWAYMQTTVLTSCDASLVPRLSRNANMYRLYNFNVRVPERGSLGTRLMWCCSRKPLPRSHVAF